MRTPRTPVTSEAGCAARARVLRGGERGGVRCLARGSRTVLGEAELFSASRGDGPLDPEQSHRLVVYTAVPGGESHDRLRLLAVIGPQALR
ncbi:hypothetical protein [Streptomyces atroolivaceus]|uniref:hypothetical protein n=1 Tax=Streptomyces atroolivaceus TaxID=66869 RepID=UPI00362A0ED9